jgi:hypothetical protein
MSETDAEDRRGFVEMTNDIFRNARIRRHARSREMTIRAGRFFDLFDSDLLLR